MEKTQLTITMLTAVNNWEELYRCIWEASHVLL